MKFSYKYYLKPTPEKVLKYGLAAKIAFSSIAASTLLASFPKTAIFFMLMRELASFICNCCSSDEDTTDANKS